MNNEIGRESEYDKDLFFDLCCEMRLKLDQDPDYDAAIDRIDSWFLYCEGNCD